MGKNKKLNLPIIDPDVDLIQQQSLHTYGEEDDEKFITYEIMRVTNAIEEAVEVEQNEVVGVVVFDDGKVACDICRKRFQAL
jgi:hypothetical protein